MAVGAVFISYRRQDAAGYAGRLQDALAAHFGDERVFMDVGAIEPGADFAQQIDEAVGSCDVLLAVIGPGWAAATDVRGRRRLDDPDDFVALEVGTALQRPDVKVIPVLVDGARMPMPEELPSALAALGRRQAIELSAARWRYDVETLLKTLERALGRVAPAEQRQIAEPERSLARGEAVAVPLADAPALERARIAEPTSHDEPAQRAKARNFTWLAISAGVVVALGVAAVLTLGGSGGGGSSNSDKLPPGGTSTVVDNAKPPKRGDHVVAAAQTNVKGNHYRLVLSTRGASGSKRAKVPLYMNLYAGQPFKLLERRVMPYSWYPDSVVATLKVEANRDPNPEKTAGVEMLWFLHLGDQTDVTHYFGLANHGIDIVG